MIVGFFRQSSTSFLRHKLRWFGKIREASVCVDEVDEGCRVPENVNIVLSSYIIGCSQIKRNVSILSSDTKTFLEFMFLERFQVGHVKIFELKK